MSILRTSRVVVSSTAKPRSGEREITVPGRKDAPRVAAASPGELRTARLLVGITTAAGLAFAIVAFVGFQLILYNIRPDTASVAECVEDMDCDEGQLCQTGRCRASSDESICEPGDSCGPCSCKAPMSCKADLCTEPEPPPPPACDDPELQKALARLEKECKGNLGTCEPGSLEKFAMKDKSFDALISAFQGVITVHFETGKPPLDGTTWPDAKTRAYYVERLRRSAEALRTAKYIFIIARSSPHGNARRNGLFAQQRSIHTKELLFAALDLSVAERDAFGAKFREFILGPKRKLDREFFAQRYSNHFITWSKISHDLLLKLIKSDEVSSKRDEQWADDTINQVVLVVPVTCELKPPTGE